MKWPGSMVTTSRRLAPIFSARIETGFRKVDPQKLKEMTEAGKVRQKRKNEFTAIMERDGEWFVAARRVILGWEISGDRRSGRR